MVHPPTEIDPFTSPVLERQLEACDPSGLTEVDMADVVFCDASGLRVLVRQHKRHAGERGRLVVCNLHGVVADVFAVTRLDDLLSGSERSI